MDQSSLKDAQCATGAYEGQTQKEFTRLKGNQAVRLSMVSIRLWQTKHRSYLDASEIVHSTSQMKGRQGPKTGFLIPIKRDVKADSKPKHWETQKLSEFLSGVVLYTGGSDWTHTGRRHVRSLGKNKDEMPVSIEN
eukprot:767398-Hanusia_phi.AAC.4